MPLVKLCALLYPRIAAGCKTLFCCVCFHPCLKKGFMSRIPAFDKHPSEELSRKGERRHYSTSLQMANKTDAVELLLFCSLQ